MKSFSEDKPKPGDYQSLIIITSSLPVNRSSYITTKLRHTVKLSNPHSHICRISPEITFRHHQHQRSIYETVSWRTFPGNSATNIWLDNLSWSLIPYGIGILTRSDYCWNSYEVMCVGGYHGNL